MNSWILVFAISAFGGPEIEVQGDLTQQQCIAIANAITTTGQRWAACYGPDGEEIEGKEDLKP